MIGRKKEMPKIFLAKYFVESKSEDQAREKPGDLYYNIRYALYQCAVMYRPAVSHNSHYSRGGEHGYCNLEKLEKYKNIRNIEHFGVQHPSECAQHTIEYLLPNDVSVRINPIILDVERGTETVKSEYDGKWPLRKKYVDEICVEVIVRSTKEKQQKGLEKLLNSVGVITCKETNEAYIYRSY